MSRNRGSSRQSEGGSQESQLWAQVVSALKPVPKDQDRLAHVRFSRLMSDGTNEGEEYVAMRERTLTQLDEEERALKRDIEAFEKAQEKLQILIALRAVSPPNPTSQPLPPTSIPTRLKIKSDPSASPSSAARSPSQPRSSPAPVTPGSSQTSIGKESKASAGVSGGSGGSAVIGAGGVRNKAVGLAAQLPLTDGRRVAFKAPTKPGENPPGPGEGWILTVVKRCLNAEKHKYEVIDTDEDPPATYITKLSNLIPLPDKYADPSHPSHPARYDSRPAGSTVLALYPGTSTFYKATVISRDKSKAAGEGKYNVKFEDDDDQVHSLEVGEVAEWPGK